MESVAVINYEGAVFEKKLCRYRLSMEAFRKEERETEKIK